MLWSEAAIKLRRSRDITIKVHFYPSTFFGLLCWPTLMKVKLKCIFRLFLQTTQNEEVIFKKANSILLRICVKNYSSRICRSNYWQQVSKRWRYLILFQKRLESFTCEEVQRKAEKVTTFLSEKNIHITLGIWNWNFPTFKVFTSFAFFEKGHIFHFSKNV